MALDWVDAATLQHIGAAAATAGVAAAGSWAALDLFIRLRSVLRHASWVLPVAPAAVMGLTIWTANFVALLSDGPVSSPGAVYSPLMAALSLLLAVASMTPAFIAAALARSPGRRRPPIGAGFAMGLGIWACNYATVAALQSGTLRVDAPAVLAAAVFATVLVAITAFWLTIRAKGPKARLFGALLLGVAVAGMHHGAVQRAATIADMSDAAGMSAAGRTPQDTSIASVVPQGMAPTPLAFAVGGATALLLVLGAVGSGSDRMIRIMVARKSRRLYVARLRAVADRLPVGLVFVSGAHDGSGWSNRMARRLLGREGAPRMARTVIAARGADWIQRFVWSGPDGPIRLEASVASLPAATDADGDKGMIVAFRDVSDLAACEEDARRSWHSAHAKPGPDAIARELGDMLQAMGMAMGTLHGSFQQTATGGADPGGGCSAVSVAGRLLRQASEQGESLIRDLTAPVARPPAAAEAIDLVSWLARETHEMLGDVVGADIEVELRAEQDLGPVMAPVEGLEESLMGIADRQACAMGRSGKLLIEVAYAVMRGEESGGLTHAFVGISLSGSTGDLVDGDPSIARADQFARGAGGYLRVERHPGAGTKVTLILPAADD